MHVIAPLALAALAAATAIAGAPPALADAPETTLTVRRERVRIAGIESEAMTLNGQIPGPTLRWRVGDRARIRVRNEMEVATSVHWHGILLPNREDGVPGVTTPPIAPGGERIFEFPIRQSGTYWYHSHTGLQEQRGLYGAIVIDPTDAPEATLRDAVLVLSDWTRRSPQSVMRRLKRGSEQFAFEKGRVPSLWGAMRAGAVGATLRRALMRMPPMDLSDVAYDAFLANGAPEARLSGSPGERVRLRVINAAASSYFYLDSARGPLQLVAADGLEVEPVSVPRLLIAVAETYDLVVVIPASGSYELRATAQDGSGSASLWIGEGERHEAQGPPSPSLYSGNAGHEHTPPGAAPPKGASRAPEGHRQHAHAAEMGPDVAPVARPLPPYEHLRTRTPPLFPASAPQRAIRLRLTGDMERYVWSFDGRTLSEADVIPVAAGEVLRIDLENQTMMHHPLHLHGHFFRVVHPHGRASPWKHTVDVAPMATTTIEFYGSEDREWFFHCHVLYHMKAGMARIFRYRGSVLDDDLQASRSELLRDPWYPAADVSIFSNFTEGEMWASAPRHTLALEWEVGWQRTDGVDYELLPVYRHHLNRLYRWIVGGSFEDDRNAAVFGAEALLPLQLESRVWIDTRGNGRFALAKSLRLVPRLSLRGEAEYDTDPHWRGSVGLGWRLHERADLGFRWHSEYGFGGGLELRF